MTAVRVDDATGVEERIQFLPTQRGNLYTWTALPPAARSCVVVCSSIFGDFTANYHRERRLGHELADHGLGVIRFHYAGEGNSGGERADMTFGSLCEDTKAILDHALAMGFTDLAIVGTRVAASVAAASVATIPSAPLVLWEPVMQPLRSISEATRAKLMSQIATPGKGDRTTWKEELSQEGVLDLLGYDIYPALVESFTSVDLMTSLGEEPRPVLVAGFSLNASPTSRLVEELGNRGFEASANVYDLKESWWFQSEEAPLIGALVSDTAAWLVERLRQPDDV